VRWVAAQNGELHTPSGPDESCRGREIRIFRLTTDSFLSANLVTQLVSQLEKIFELIHFGYDPFQIVPNNNNGSIPFLFNIHMWLSIANPKGAKNEGKI